MGRCFRQIGALPMPRALCQSSARARLRAALTHSPSSLLFPPQPIATMLSKRLTLLLLLVLAACRSHKSMGARACRGLPGPHMPLDCCWGLWAGRLGRGSGSSSSPQAAVRQPKPACSCPTLGIEPLPLDWGGPSAPAVGLEGAPGVWVLCRPPGSALPLATATAHPWRSAPAANPNPSAPRRHGLRPQAAGRARDQHQRRNLRCRQ